MLSRLDSNFDDVHALTGKLLTMGMWMLVGSALPMELAHESHSNGLKPLTKTPFRH
jgi:hypothetical protein